MSTGTILSQPLKRVFKMIIKYFLTSHTPKIHDVHAACRLHKIRFYAVVYKVKTSFMTKTTFIQAKILFG